MEEVLAKLDVCMATLDKMATRRDEPSLGADTVFRERPYTSMVRVNGKPILPPLMTQDRRVEMMGYREEAIQREREREERKRQRLVAQVETIVNSYEDSRHSLDSKENSPQQKSIILPGHAEQASDKQPGEVPPPPEAQRLKNPSYSPLKYTETDEDEWNVRPATPWRRSKQSKPRATIAANFEPRGPHLPISSTMRVDRSQDVRGTTPDLSAISLASSQAYNTISPCNDSAGEGIDRNNLANMQPVLKEVLPMSPPGLRNLQAKTVDGKKAYQPVKVASNIATDAKLKERDIQSQTQKEHSYDISMDGANGNNENGSQDQMDRSHDQQKDGSHDHFENVSPESSHPRTDGAHIDSAVISRLSPIPKTDAVQTSVTSVSRSTGSQSTSSSSNSALNQTVIDLSQMTIAQDQTSSENSQTQPALTAESTAIIEEVKDDTEVKESKNLIPSRQEDHQAAGYLSDTESYMSLLGEYSLLPTRGSNRAIPDPKKDVKKVPFFPEPNSPDALDLKHGAKVEQSTGPSVEDIKYEKLPIASASIEADESLKSTDMSEYCGSSLGTLAQSVTLPMSLSVTSESTLHGMEVAWDRTSQDVTPTGTEGGMSGASDELNNTGMVRAAPVGQESDGACEVSKQTNNATGESTSKQSPNEPQHLVVLPQTKASSNDRSGVNIERSGVNVHSDFQTPHRHHARKSSYTLDFPSPALLDAEARHQAPHVSGREVNYTVASTEITGVDVQTDTKAMSDPSAVMGGDDQQSDALTSDMKDLKIGDVSEAKVLSLQLACLEQMQQRLQRQHEEQMKELMLQQSQELCLLECEMEGIRRQAAESAQGHVEDMDHRKSPTEVKVSSDESLKKKTAFQKNSSHTASSADKESSEVSPNEKKIPPPSPNSRKRRFEESQMEGMVQVLPSYIKPSLLAGKGHAFPGFQSLISEKLLANAKKKLTPQDSLDSDHTGDLVEVPPSYIKSGSYHKPVSRSPTHHRSVATPINAGPAQLASPSIPADVTTNGVSSQLTTWGTPPKGDEVSKLSSWASPAVANVTGASGYFDQALVSDPVHVNSVSDSFFLTDGHNEEPADRQTEETHQHQKAASYFRPWTITPSLQMDSRFDRISAGVKGYLTRALMRTPKVKALIKTIKDTQVFLYQFQAETPVKRGKLSEQDTKLAHRVLAQLRAAQYELDDVFHAIPINQRMMLLRQTREQERENFFNKKVSPPSIGQKHLSAATKKAMERRQQLTKEGDDAQSGPKRQKLVPSNQRPKSAAETRVVRPLQGHKAPARPATAIPPRVSSLAITTHSQKPSNQSKPFPTKPIMITRNTTKTARSPSRPSSRATSSRLNSTRPTSRLSGVVASQARTTTARQAKSPARVTTGSQPAKTKSVRRSLYPVTVGTGKKTMQRKQVDNRKP